MADFNEIIKDSRPTLVDFFATWCGPCRMQAPILEQVKNTVGDKANVIKVDVDKNQPVAALYKVQSIPTLILFVGGEAVWRATGLQQAQTLVDVISQHSK
ncbi:MAG: thioredoxin [Muribaculaceae bacterium]|nr:thioredoxin [Muribaculaceae bacterium]